MRYLVLAVLLTICGSSIAHAAITIPPGIWKVIEQSDPMTDKITVLAMVVTEDHNAALAANCDNGKINLIMDPPSAIYGNYTFMPIQSRVDKKPAEEHLWVVVHRNALKMDDGTTAENIAFIKSLVSAKEQLVFQPLSGPYHKETLILSAKNIGPALNAVLAACGH